MKNLTCPGTGNGGHEANQSPDLARSEWRSLLPQLHGFPLLPYNGRTGHLKRPIEQDARPAPPDPEHAHPSLVAWLGFGPSEGGPLL